MTSVVDQLRDYRAILDESVPEVDVDAIIESVPADAGLLDVEMLMDGPVRRGRVLAVAAVAASLVIGVAVVMFDRSTETSSPVTTEEAPGDAFDQLSALDGSDVPSFRATGTYRMIRDTMEATVVMQTEYLADGGGMRMTLVEGHPQVAPAGTFGAWFETVAVTGGPTDDAGVETFGFLSTQPTIHPFAWQSRFGDVCDREDVEILDSSTVLGRTAHVLRCVNLRGQWEMTVDAESGLILALTGSYSTSDGDGGVPVSSEPGGGFELTELVVGPNLDETAVRAELTELESIGVPLSVDEDLAGPPALHLVHSSTLYREILEAEVPEGEVSGDQTIVTELWYENPDRWRLEYVQGDHPHGEATGTFLVRSGDEAFRYDATHQTWEAIPVAGDREGIDPLGWIGIHRFENEQAGPCRSETESEVGGRSVQVLDGCPIPGGADPIAVEAASRRSLPLTMTYEVDAATKLITRYQAPSGHAEVTTFDIDPFFPDGIFDLTPPPDAYDITKGEYPPPTPSELVGQAPPPLPTTLVGGGSLDPASLDGRPVAVLFWATWCDPCLDALEAMQPVADRDGSDTAYVTVVVGDDPSRVIDTVARGDIDMPVVSDPDSHYFEQWDGPGIPVLALVSADGTVAEVHLGGDVAERLAGLPGEGW